jgi:hypothetical protein
MKRNPCEQHSNMAAQVAGDGYSCIYCLYSLAEKDNADLQSKLDEIRRILDQDNLDMREKLHAIIKELK